MSSNGKEKRKSSWERKRSQLDLELSKRSDPRRRDQMEHDEAGESNFLYFEGLKIYQAENGFFRMTRHFSTFREDPDREKVFNVVPEFIVLLKKSDFLKKVYYEVEKVSEKIRLTPSTKFLALHLAKNYLANERERKLKKILDQDYLVFTHCAIFLAAKMRERDIYCPMISHMRRAGGRRLNYDDFRVGEMKICEFFNWNISMMTFWDFLEQFLSLGVLLEDDHVLNQDSYSNTDITQGLTKSRQKEMSYMTPEPEESQVLKFDNKQKIKTGSNLTTSPNNDKGIMERRKISRLSHQSRSQLITKIQQRSIDLAQQIVKRFHTDSQVQREIAYLIIVISRKEAGIWTPDRDKLLRLHQVTKRDLKEFERCLIEVPTSCPDSTEFLDFDAVERVYTKEGELISDFGKKKKKRQKRWNGEGGGEVHQAEAKPQGGGRQDHQRQSQFEGEGGQREAVDYLKNIVEGGDADDAYKHVRPILKVDGEKVGSGEDPRDQVDPKNNPLQGSYHYRAPRIEKDSIDLVDKNPGQDNADDPYRIRSLTNTNKYQQENQQNHGRNPSNPILGPSYNNYTKNKQKAGAYGAHAGEVIDRERIPPILVQDGLEQLGANQQYFPTAMDEQETARHSDRFKRHHVEDRSNDNSSKQTVLRGLHGESNEMVSEEDMEIDVGEGDEKNESFYLANLRIPQLKIDPDDFVLKEGQDSKENLSNLKKNSSWKKRNIKTEESYNDELDIVKIKSQPTNRALDGETSLENLDHIKAQPPSRISKIKDLKLDPQNDQLINIDEGGIDVHRRKFARVKSEVFNYMSEPLSKPSSSSKDILRSREDILNIKKTKESPQVLISKGNRESLDIYKSIERKSKQINREKSYFVKLSEPPKLSNLEPKQFNKTLKESSTLKLSRSRDTLKEQLSKRISERIEPYNHHGEYSGEPVEQISIDIGPEIVYKQNNNLKSQNAQEHGRGYRGLKSREDLSRERSNHSPTLQIKSKIVSNKNQPKLNPSQVGDNETTHHGNIKIKKNNSKGLLMPNRGARNDNNNTKLSNHANKANKLNRSGSHVDNVSLTATSGVKLATTAEQSLINGGPRRQKNDRDAQLRQHPRSSSFEPQHLDFHQRKSSLAYLHGRQIHGGRSPSMLDNQNAVLHKTLTDSIFNTTDRFRHSGYNVALGTVTSTSKNSQKHQPGFALNRKFSHPVIVGNGLSSSKNYENQKRKARPKVMIRPENLRESRPVIPSLRENLKRKQINEQQRRLTETDQDLSHVSDNGGDEGITVNINFHARRDAPKIPDPIDFETNQNQNKRSRAGSRAAQGQSLKKNYSFQSKLWNNYLNKMEQRQERESLRNQPGGVTATNWQQVEPHTAQRQPSPAYSGALMSRKVSNYSLLSGSHYKQMSHLRKSKLTHSRHNLGKGATHRRDFEALKHSGVKAEHSRINQTQALDASTKADRDASQQQRRLLRNQRYSDQAFMMRSRSRTGAEYPYQFGNNNRYQGSSNNNPSFQANTKASRNKHALEGSYYNQLNNSKNNRSSRTLKLNNSNYGADPTSNQKGEGFYQNAGQQDRISHLANSAVNQNKGDKRQGLTEAGSGWHNYGYYGKGRAENLNNTNTAAQKQRVRRLTNDASNREISRGKLYNLSGSGNNDASGGADRGGGRAYSPMNTVSQHQNTATGKFTVGRSKASNENLMSSHQQEIKISIAGASTTPFNEYNLHDSSFNKLNQARRYSRPGAYSNTRGDQEVGKNRKTNNSKLGGRRRDHSTASNYYQPGSKAKNAHKLQNKDQRSLRDLQAALVNRGMNTNQKSSTNLESKPPHDPYVPGFLRRGSSNFLQTKSRAAQLNSAVEVQGGNHNSKEPMSYRNRRNAMSRNRTFNHLQPKVESSRALDRSSSYYNKQGFNNRETSQGFTNRLNQPKKPRRPNQLEGSRYSRIKESSSSNQFIGGGERNSRIGDQGSRLRGVLDRERPYGRYAGPSGNPLRGTGYHYTGQKERGDEGYRAGNVEKSGNKGSLYRNQSEYVLGSQANNNNPGSNQAYGKKGDLYAAPNKVGQSQGFGGLTGYGGGFGGSGGDKQQKGSYVAGQGVGDGENQGADGSGYGMNNSANGYNRQRY